jgi:sporulation protein YlmC with PRC-barrel domain
VGEAFSYTAKWVGAQTARRNAPKFAGEHRPMGTTLRSFINTDYLLEFHMNYEERDTYGMYKVNASSVPGSDARQGPGPELMGADTLIGNDVYNQNDEDLGDIKEIMLDVRSGRVSYAVLSFGGFLGMGDKLFAVPWSALTLDTVNKRFLLNVEKDRLESAPGFDKDQWPNMADPSWAQGIHDYYGTKPYADNLPG